VIVGVKSQKLHVDLGLLPSHQCHHCRYCSHRYHWHYHHRYHNLLSPLSPLSHLNQTRVIVTSLRCRNASSLQNCYPKCHCAHLQNAPSKNTTPTSFPLNWKFCKHRLIFSLFSVFGNNCIKDIWQYGRLSLLAMSSCDRSTVKTLWNPTKLLACNFIRVVQKIWKTWERNLKKGSSTWMTHIKKLLMSREKELIMQDRESNKMEN
jgi:hypothetical protein